MRSVNGKIRITSLSAGLLYRAASGFACVRARARAPLLEERGNMI
jgi:hypothetical protein